MTLAQFGGLFVVYLVSLTFILTLTYQEFRRRRFTLSITSPTRPGCASAALSRVRRCLP